MAKKKKSRLKQIEDLARYHLNVDSPQDAHFRYKDAMWMILDLCTIPSNSKNKPEWMRMQKI